jgi:LysR family glycine cleavage system transcriptional activator
MSRSHHQFEPAMSQFRRLPSMQTLRAFEAAARHESYSAAATELGLTHGAISHRIRELEADVGVSLFRRVGRTMIPTREAVTLLAQVREALNVLQRALPPSARGTQTNKLVISVHPSLATHWFIPNIGSFLRAEPRADIEVRTTAELGQFLSQGVNVAIRYGAGNWPNVVGQRICGEVQFPVCTREYAQKHNLRTPADLKNCTLLRHAWQLWTPWFRAADLRMREPSRTLMLSDSSMLVEAAAAGEGVALVRGLIARGAIQSGRLIRPFDIAIQDSYSYYLLWHANTQLSSVGTALLEWLRRTAGEPDTTLQTRGSTAHVEAPRAGKGRSRKRANTASEK